MEIAEDELIQQDQYRPDQHVKATQADGGIFMLTRVPNDDPAAASLRLCSIRPCRRYSSDI